MLFVGKGRLKRGFSSPWQPFSVDFVNFVHQSVVGRKCRTCWWATYPRNCYFTVSISSGRELHFSQGHDSMVNNEQHAENRCSSRYQPVFSNNRMIATILTVLVHCIIDVWMCTFLAISIHFLQVYACKEGTILGIPHESCGKPCDMPFPCYASCSCTCSSTINGIIWQPADRAKTQWTKTTKHHRK